MYKLDALVRALGEFEIHPTGKQLEQFGAYLDVFLRWNARTNLSSVREPDEIMRRHFAESAYLTRVLPLGAGTLVDIGSGGGFPGIPVKILSPETRVILVESVQKKAAFLKEAARVIGLPGLEVFAGRFEQLKTEANWLTLRAVKLDRSLLSAMCRDVPRGTVALFMGAEDAAKLGPFAQVHPIPGSERRVIAIASLAECSTWNIS